MPNQTKNYGLVKPLPEEFYDVEVQNSNMDKIDEALKKQKDAGDKYLPLDGSKAMTGGILSFDDYNSGDTTGSLLHSSGATFIYANSNEPMAKSDYRRMGVFSKQASSSISTAASITDYDNGVIKSYNLFGEHNKEFLSGKNISLPLYPGFSGIEESINAYHKNADSEVTINFGIRKDSGTFMNSEVLFALPAGFRPIAKVSGICDGVNIQSGGSVVTNQSAVGFYITNTGLFAMNRVSFPTNYNINSIAGSITFKAS